MIRSLSMSPLLHLRAVAARRTTLLAAPIRASPSLSAASASASRRTYQGEAGEMQARAGNDDISRREQKLWDRARPRYDTIMERHLRLPTDESADDNLAVRKKRLVYRSKQRGWLEVDLLLGTWASENVASLDSVELDEYENFVNMETIDIYNVVTLRSDVPEEMKGSEGEEGRKSVVERIQEWARQSPLGKANAEKYAEIKNKHNLI